MLTVFNDWHLGVNRTGGTTPMSFGLLTNYTFDYATALLKAASGPLLINGDLLDGFTVSNAAVRRTFDLLHDYAAIEGNEIYLARGNHDYSRDSTKVSSFDLLGAMLEKTCSNVWVISEPTIISPADSDNSWVIPHAPNQDIFDLWLEGVKERPTDIVFVHSNFDNNFALEQDHSLNLSRDKLQELCSAGVRTVVFGHEHQQKIGTGFCIVGNQFPTSVSDCLGNRTKQYITIDNGVIRFKDCWHDGDEYFECDWTQVATVPADRKFVRVRGEVSSEQAAAVFAAIAKLRRTHAAFVVTNAVKIDGQALDVSALEAVDSVDKFSVETFLIDNLQNERQRGVVREILAARPAH